MNAAWIVAALVAFSAGNANGYFGYFGYGREASQNYHEMMTNCEREGGECKEVDFSTPDPPPPPPIIMTPAPTPVPFRPTLPPTLPPSFLHGLYMLQTLPPYVPPPQVPVTPAPVATTRAPPATTLAPPVAPMAALPAVPAAPPVAPPAATAAGTPLPKPRPNAGFSWRNLNQGAEVGVRHKRQVFMDPYSYLSMECKGGWEFDIGCSVKGGNVCCYSSNNGYRK